jgi:putative Mg2+ transporter-C (MgtC) family protein
MDYKQALLCLASMGIALILGFAIGFERKLRFKEAGTRTHTIMCVGACLYMLISKYAFNGIGDPGRIAAQVVSGIGFLGAGMIFHHKQNVHGLTTAAGIWATAAVGMAVGAGTDGEHWMWVVAAGATFIIILVQCVMHLPFKIFHSHKYVRLNVIFRCDNGDEREIVKKAFGINRFSKIHAEKDSQGIIYRTIVTTDATFTDVDLYNALKDYPFLISISREDDDI